MVHPELLLVPIMMFADYFLTVIGVIQRERKYSQYFKTQHYELNPLWQERIAQKKWFNPRHAVLTIVLSVILVSLVEFGGLPGSFIEGILGCIFVVYGLILGRHLSNLLIFRHLIRNPEDISGEITMSHQFVLSLSLYQCLMVVIPITLIALFSSSCFAYGGTVGIAGFLAFHLVWLQRAKERQSPPKL